MTFFYKLSMDSSFDKIICKCVFVCVFVIFCVKMLTDEEILTLYKDPKFPGSFSGVKTFRDFLFVEKHELVSEKRLYDILKQDANYLSNV